MEKTPLKKLIFVYNADSGTINQIKDYFHKIISPNTYDCNLCAVSYGNLGMRQEWKSYITQLEIPAEFLHRDEFIDRFPGIEDDFPSAFLLYGSEIEQIIPSNEINQVKTIKELKELTNGKIRKILT